MELSALHQSISQRLMRKTQTVCSRWAEQNILMGEPFPGPFQFRYHPWTEEMHNSEAPLNVGQKSAQMGYSVTLLNRALFMIDIRKENVLYLLPTKTPDATDFSSTRFDPLLESSPRLRTLFSDVKNVGAKRAGGATLFIRGSNSRASLKSIPVSTILFDEFDEMMQKNIPLARERTSGQRHSQEWVVSTPTLPGHGISLEFQRTTQEHYFFPCPRCGRRIELLHENLVIPNDDPAAAYIQCLLCEQPLTDPKETQEQLTARKMGWFPGEWVVTGVRDPERRGFYINQLYSCAVAGNPKALATAYIESLTNRAREQEYHNSKMGTAHEVEGARLTEELIIESISNHRKLDRPPNKLITMGIDVGAWLHIEIVAWDIKTGGKDINHSAHATVIWEGKRPAVAGFPDLDELMRQYNVHMCVIDANPERASAMAFAKRFWGFVKLCFYGKGVANIELPTVDSAKHTVTVDRTQWLDVALGRFKAGTISLPQDLSLEYRKHLTNIARIYEEDNLGNPIGRYVNTSDDHFAHARNYAEIALPLAAGHKPNEDIT